MHYQQLKHDRYKKKLDDVMDYSVKYSNTNNKNAVCCTQGLTVTLDAKWFRTGFNKASLVQFLERECSILSLTTRWNHNSLII